MKGQCIKDMAKETDQRKKRLRKKALQLPMSQYQVV